MSATLGRYASQLKGLRCWGLVAGVGNGSMMTIHLGDKIKRDPPLQNQHLPEDLRRFQGEFCVFVQGCAWRLRAKDKLVCSWGDTPIRIGQKTRSLVRKSVTAVETFEPSFDLKLTFGSDHLLELFCDQSSAGDALENYSLRLPTGWFTIGPDSALSRESTEVGTAKELTR